jgi:hypothetical protein
MEEPKTLSENTDTPAPTNADLLKNAEKTKEEAPKSPDQMMSEAISDYKFLSYNNGVLNVAHPELTQYLKPVILKMGNMVKRGTVIANLSGGLTNIDPQTKSLNESIATVLVGFEELPKKDLLLVEDTDLIMGLYVAVVSYNTFFRKTPLGFVL